jgi:outer membrane protein OmpA-like peptidoglycan-associated protein
MKRNLVIVLLIPFFYQYVLGQSETYSVNKAFFSSEKYDEFSPVYYNHGIGFCTNRYSGISNHTTSQNKGLFKIYYIDTVNDHDWKSAKIFSKSLTTIVNDGPVSFNKSKDTIYFSRNQDISGKLSDVSSPRNKLGIYCAVNKNGEWTNISELRIDNEWYNVTTPCLSPDGKKLYFASDKPGGFGGSDLYYSLWKDERWEDPVNLGPVINTSGNESYPFVNSAGELFFSSDGHPGLGGKDIYFSTFSDSTWTKPVPLDPPINSEYDDFAFISDSLMNDGFFSTNRRGSVDIYHFKTLIHQVYNCKEQRTNEYCFKFSDDSKIPINEKYLKYVWSFGDGVNATGLNVEHCFKGAGKYEVMLDVVEKNSGKIFFTKLSYNLELKDIEQPIINSVPSALVGEMISFDGLRSFFPGCHVLVYTWYFGDGDRTTGKSVSHKYKAKGEYEIKLGLMLQEDKTGKIFQACTSKRIILFSNGAEKASYDVSLKKTEEKLNILKYDHAFINNLYSAEKEYNQDLVFQVEILSSKTRLNLDNKAFANLPNKFFVKEVHDRADSSYSYIADEEMNLMDTYPTFNELVALGFKNTGIRSFVLVDPAAKELLTLKKVFGVSTDVLFKQNDISLSSAGTQLLDLIMGFMAKYPAVKLEISTYTDDSGSSASNLLISQKRADLMVNYLVINGVNVTRLIAKGYGSSRPINLNSDEAQRKLNRRVDFTIIR